ncbi:MAG: nitroreductase family protein [Nanoarchaeota archaeon]|nr:nitroreductase family protein [Nanoarchaeota archaeon]
MNETIKTIKERRSVRAYKDKPIEKEKINEILECGLMAPNARHLQPWKFIVVANKDLIKEIAKRIQDKVIDNPRYSFVKERAKTKEDAIFYSAPLVVFILGDKENHWSVMDCSMAAENMMLAAKSLGIASCPIGMARFVKEEKDLVHKLGFDPNYELIITLVFGYPDEEPEVKERNKDVIKWVE